MSTILIDDRTKATADYRFALPDFGEEEDERVPNAETLEAMEDERLGGNMYGPYKTVDEAMKALSED